LFQILSGKLKITDITCKYRMKTIGTELPKQVPSRRTYYGHWKDTCRERHVEWKPWPVSNELGLFKRTQPTGTSSEMSWRRVENVGY
jgi:hypothetical protein